MRPIDIRWQHVQESNKRIRKYNTQLKKKEDESKFNISPRNRIKHNIR